MKKLTLTFLIPLQLFATPLCKEWSAPKAIGELEVEVLPEASGMAISRNFPNRIYHHNDSGDAGNFYLTDLKGKTLQTVSITGFDPMDVEDMTIGECGRKSDCLFFGDIGDNDAVRESVEIIVIEEQKTFAKSVKPLKRLILTYPEEAHNAEALVVDPEGNLFIFTKEQKGEPTYIFKVDKSRLRSIKVREEIELEEAGEWNVANLLGKSVRITGADLSSDGTRLLLLANGDAVEVAWNSNNPSLKTHSEVVPLGLKKTEAASYLPDLSGFLFSIESNDTRSAPLSEVKCKVFYP